ncbi:MAG: Omp28-related outer membrane protein [Chitinophagales bacterium]
MKKAFITLCGCVLVFAGCMEKGPPINFANVVVADTTYLVSPVPAADPHNVLAEEFTGQSCPNCPAAHDLLTSLAATTNPMRLNVIGLYIYHVTQANPPSGAAYDFRTQTATDISSSIYSGGPASGIPCGGIDRVPVGGTLFPYSSSWTDAYNQRLNMTDSVNLSVTSGYNAVDTTDTITATVTYTTQVSTQQNLSIAIVEDSIIDLQDMPAGINNNYLFTNVFRGMVTSEPYGDPVSSKLVVKAPGTRNVRTYIYKVNSAWKAKHCRIIAFVHYSNADPTKKDVFQSVQTKVTP